MPPSRRARLALVAAALAVLPSAGRAATVTWSDVTSGQFGEWSQAYRWAGGNVPGVDDDAVIDLSSVDIRVLVKLDHAVRSVVSTEALTIEAGSLNVAAASTFNGAFNLTGGALGGAGDVTLNGPSTWVNQSTMNGAGKTVVSATGTLTVTPGNYHKFLERNLDNFGTITANNDDGFGPTFVMTAATIANKVGATFNVNSALNNEFYGAAGANAFLNNGTFNKSGTGTATFGGGGSSPVAFANNGQVNLNAGGLIFQTAATHAGRFTIAAGATLRFDAPQTFTPASVIDGAGAVTFNNVGVNSSGGTVNLTGPIAFAGGVNTFNGPFAVASFSAANGAAFSFNAATTLGIATLNNTSITGAGDLTLSGASTWSGAGSMTGLGKTTLTAGGTLDLIPGGPTAKNLQRTLVNRGTVNWNGNNATANLTLAGGTFDNKPGATFNVNGTNYAFNGASGANAFLNAGTFNKAGTGSASFTGAPGSVVVLNNAAAINVSAGLLTLDAPLINSGTVTLSGGTLMLNAGLTNAGRVNVSANGILNLAGTITTAQLGQWSNTGGQVNLLGTLDNAAATLALSDTTGALRLAANSKVVGGTLSTAGASRLDVLGPATLDNLTLAGNVTISQQANLTVQTGLSLGTGATLILDAPANSLVTFSNSQSIAGAGQVTTAGAATSAATLTASTGNTLTIAPGVLVHPAARALIIGSADSAVVNQGTMSADVAAAPLTLTGTSVQNAGTVQAQNGATLSVTGPLANLSNATLTGGAWRVFADSTLRLPGPINTNAAPLTLDGVNSNILLGTGSLDALGQLAQNAPAGSLTIKNGRTLTTAQNFLNAGQLTVGPGAAWTTPSLFTNTGAAIVNGTLTTGQSVIESPFSLNGGTHTTTADFIVGNAANTARYDLSAGTLSVAGFATVGSGPGGAGVMNQAGGTFNATKQLYVSTAGTNASAYNLSGGALNTGELFVAFFGGSQGTFNQTGGAVTLTANPANGTTGGLTLGYSSLSATAGAYNLAAGTLDDQTVQIGYAGTGTFTQTGGAHTVAGPGGLNVAMFTGAAASYSLTPGATLNVAATETIGVYGQGTFTQTGGAHTVNTSLQLGKNPDSFGIFNLAGGTLTTPLVDLRRGVFNQTGGALIATTFVQEGGDVAGALTNAGVYQYLAGTFSGRLINAGSVNLIADFTAGNGLDNRASFNVSANRAVTLTGQGLANTGTLTVAGNLSATATVNHGAYNQSAGVAALGPVSGTGSATVSGGTLAAPSIRQDSLTIQNNAIVTLATGGGASRLRTLTLTGPAATIDLADNPLLIDYAGPTPAADVRAAVATGYAPAAPHWTGPGIRSAAAAADPTLAVGVVEAAALFRLSANQTATYRGETVDATTLILRATKFGDANLDGTVGFADFQRFEVGYGKSGQGWVGGDFNSDGLVDRYDFFLLQQNYGQTAGQPLTAVSVDDLSALAHFASSVPEPTTATTLLAIATLIALTRRHRRNCQR